MFPHAVTYYSCASRPFSLRFLSSYIYSGTFTNTPHITTTGLLPFAALTLLGGSRGMAIVERRGESGLEVEMG